MTARRQHELVPIEFAPVAQTDWTCFSVDVDIAPVNVLELPDGADMLAFMVQRELEKLFDEKST
jgi:hypothetical protein